MITLQRLAATAALTAALVACSDTLSPDTVDPQALNTNVTNLASTFENNVAFASMRTLAPSFPAYNATAFIRAATAALDVAAHPRATSQAPARLLASLHGATGTEALFPIDVLGKTLVWDTVTDAYIVSNLPNAPANGIRIVLYVADANTGQPSLPLFPIGNLDLTDESSPANNKLGVLVRVGGLTIADYAITATFATTSVNISAAGFVRSGDGTQQADFTITGTASASGIVLHAVIAGSDGTAIAATLSIDSTTTAIDLAVAKDHNSIAIHIEGPTSGSSAATGTIKFNGTVVATITGTADNPVFTPVGEHGLTGADIATLLQMFSQLGQFIGHFIDGVFAPAGIVFGGAITL